jgi:hypothetical protein
MSTLGSTTTVQPRGGRALSIASGIAAAVVLVFTVASFFATVNADRTTAAGDVGVVAGLVFAFILIAYLLVIVRAPSGSRWAYFALLAFMTTMAFSTALGASDAADKQAAAGEPNVIGLLVVSGFVALPLLYMRLRLPKAKVQS